MIANEVVYDLERSGETGMMFKVDFHTAFDSLVGAPSWSDGIYGIW